MSNSKINSKRDNEKIAKEMEIILDHIPGLVFFKDTKNKFIRVNKYLAEAHKMTKEEMIGKSCFDLYPKDQAQAYWEDDMEVIKSRCPKLNIEELWETEKGKSWVSTNKIPYFDENGEIIGIIGFSIDISEHKKAEKINKTIIQSALDGFWITDMNGRFLDVNDSYCQMIGYTREELLKMSISDIEASERPDETDQHMRKVMNQGYDRFETQHRHKDGHIIEIEVSVNHLDIEEGRLFVFLRDITERKKDQQKLKQSQEQMNSIFLNLKDTVFVISDNYEILFKNEPAHSIFGKDLVGRKCYDVIKALDQPCDRCPMITIVETNVCQVRFEQCVSFSDTKETKFFDIIMTPIENYGGQHAFVELLRDSTENRKLRDKLKESEEKYRGLYDSIKDGIIMTDMEGKILETNQAYLDMLDYTTEEVKELTYIQLTPEKWHKIEEDIVKNQIISKGCSDEYEKEYIKKDGNVLPISIRVWLIKDKDGNPEGMWGIVRDITERKKSEQTLRQSEITLRTFLNAIPESAFLMDPKGITLVANETVANRLNTDLNKLIGSCIFDFLPPHVSKERIAQIDKIFQSGQPIQFEDERFGKYIHNTIYPVLNENNEIVSLATIGFDITERKIAEKALEEQKEWLQVTLSSIGDAVIATDVNSNIMFMNATAEKLTGWEIQDAESKKISDIFKIYNEKTGKPAKNPINRVIKEGNVIGLANHTVLISKDGTKRNIADSGAPIINKDNKIIGVVLVFRDISEEYALRNAIEQSKKELEIIIDSIPGLVFYKDTNNKFIKINKYIADAHKMSKKDIEGKSCFDLYSKEQAQSYWDDDLAVIKSGKPKLNYEEQWQTEEGLKYVSSSKIPYIDENGTVKGIIGISTDITNLKTTLEALKQSEENFRALTENAYDTIIIAGDKGLMVYANKKASELLGYNNSEFEKLTIKDLMHPIEFKKVLERYEKRLKGEIVPSQYETILLHKNGKSVPIEIAAAKTIWKGKSADLAIIRNITEKKRIEEELKKYRENLEELVNSRTLELKTSEEKYRNLYELNKDGIAMVDIEGKLIDCNQAYLDMLGYTREEINKLTYQQLTPEKWQKVDEDIVKNQIMIRGYSDEYEKEYFKKDGTAIPVNLKAWLIKDKNDNILGMWGIVRDITERKKIEAALKNSEEKYRTIITNLDEAFYNVTLQGTLLDHNKRFNEILGFDLSKDLKGVQLPDFWQNPAERELYKQELIKNGYIKSYLIKAKKQNGESIVVKANSHIIFNQKGAPVRIEGTFVDITKEYFLEQNLKTTLEELKRSNAELEQFAYVASHDLQEPLRMVASFTQLLAKRYKDKLDKDANDFINFAVDGATRMQSLINDLLIFSRVGTRGKIFTSIDTNIILKTVLNNLRASIEETKAKISYDPLPVIIADDSQMMQLFQNLISNAIKFHRMDVSPEIHVSAEVKKDEWVFYVRDNGIGIDNQFFDRLFIIFQRLHKKDEYGGTGIGLAVCKKIVQRHGGKIWVESEPGKGSTFYFTIPKIEIVYNNQEKL